MIFTGTIKTLCIRMNQIKIPTIVINFNNDILSPHSLRVTPIYGVLQLIKLSHK